MRVIVFFDLPIETVENRREYRHFHNYLIKNGFIMIQKSVYCKLALNQNVATSIIYGVKKYKPKEGLVEILTITEKQFSRIDYVVGEFKTDVIADDRRLIIL